ncbi:G-type lectin S-receptor-like serine/threonine-protein kinase [Senna tora]|uniref:G-type lectin S-receptor-like serine/threonine-protein kinase n=1 Tax=Senna tora TaxID=362788 RepID=A0A834XH25_9FABA|nr:G-type lectin S-receptor-like serine/threonine-protein kinase [Senna tora]
MTIDEDDSENLSISDCEANCWSDCECVGFLSISDEGRGCNYIYENYKGAVIGNDSLIINFLVQRNTNTNQGESCYL